MIRLLTLLIGALLATTAVAETATLGVLAFRDQQQTAERWQPTADYLSRAVEGTDFRVAPMNYPGLEEAIADGEVDFVLTNTGHYVKMEAGHGLTRLATLITEVRGTPVRVFGGILFTRADHPTIRELGDLPGHDFRAVGTGSLGGWLVGWETLHDAGIDPGSDLASMEFTGMPHDRVVEAVLAGDADAGTVRTGVLEGMIAEGRLQREDVRILHRQQTAGFPLLHSTRLYPEWPFSRMPHTRDELAEAVTVALLGMPAEHRAAVAGDYHGWSAPLSYGPVHELFRKLEVAPYEPRPLDLHRLWSEYANWLLGALLLLLAGASAAALKYRGISRALGWEVEERRLVERHLREHQARLSHQANHDPLTDLPNRSLLTTRLEQAIARADRSRQGLAVLFLDLDRFKNINDSLGHAVGDELLQALGQRLTHRLQADTVARLGGDEFIILLEGVTEPAAAATLAEEVLEAIREPFAIGNWDAMHIGGCIGISLYPDDATSAADLITHADAAMFHAKSRGRNTYDVYSRALTTAATERLELEARLRQALDQGALDLHYQPQLAAADRTIIGVEALVRWEDPELGTVTPDRFIPVAEESGLIERLGEWVLTTACHQAARWREEGHELRMAVNISAHELARADLPGRVASVLAESGLPAESLELEITESALMDRADEAATLLHTLKGLGVRLAVDDFGTGYSSLAYLKLFAVDTLKIDRCFIRELPDNGDDAEIATTILAMGHHLGLEVLAEGVETEEQLAFLRHHGCNLLQGFLFSRPVPAGQLPGQLPGQLSRPAGP